MRYLKSYKIFESSDPTESKIYQDIQDILVELNDVGILTEIVPVDGYDPITFDTIEEFKYEITIQGKLLDSDWDDSYYDPIKWGDIEEVVLRLVDFMKMKGYNGLSIMVDSRSYEHSSKDWLAQMSNKQEYEFDSLTFTFSK